MRRQLNRACCSVGDGAASAIVLFTSVRGVVTSVSVTTAMMLP